MKISTHFTFDKVRFDQDNNIHLVASLKAPKMEQLAKRPTVCVTVALDVSGSMVGEKLDYACKTLTKLVDHLQPGDYVGLVAFGSAAEVIFSPQEITQSKKETFKAQIAKIRTNGSTNLSGGMLSALEAANKMDLPAGAINRVIVLTDGHPNVGIAIDAESLTRVLTANLGKASVSMFGYGSDTNHELLGTLARIGKGNYAFIKNPDDAVSAFAKELGGLLSTYAQDIRIELQPQNGHSITEVVSDVDAQESGENVVVTLPDILSEEERHVVFSVRLVKQKKSLPRPTTAFLLNVSYSLLDENGKKVEKTESFKAAIELVKPGEEQAKASPAVDQIVGVAQLVKTQVEAEAAAARGEYKTAGAVFARAEESYMSRGLGSLGASANRIGANYSAQSYTKSAGVRNAVRSSATRGMSTSSADQDVQFFLGDNVVFENSFQASVGSSFADGGGVASGSVPPSPAMAAFGGIGSNAGTGLTAPVEPPKVEPEAPKEEKPKKNLTKKRSARW